MNMNLEEGFRNPPKSARPQVWWHWLNGSVTREGIAADLKAFAEAGISGVQIFNAAVGDKKPYIENAVAYLSPEWRELFRFALAECGRLGLEAAFHNCGGYSESGGPAVSPEQAMQKVVWSETRITSSPQNPGLPLPPLEYGSFQGPPQPMQRPRYASQSQTAYRDIAVVAFPTEEDNDGTWLRPDRIAADVIEGGTAAWHDGSDATSARLALPSPETPVCVTFEFDRPVVARSVTVSLLAWNWYREAEVQSSEDGRTWKTVAPLTGITRWDRLIPCTTSLPETRSRFFRFRFLSAMPRATCLDIARLCLHTASRLDHWEIKAAYAPAMIRNVSESAASGIRGVIDLTRYLQPDGTLNWTAPAGNWTVLRVGHTPIGVTNHPAMPDAAGLEVDKLSREAVTKYFADWPALVIDAAGDFAGRTLTGVLMDSWEVFAQNWTPAFEGEFERRRGYPLVRWLPVLAGRIVESPKQSEKFLFDFRRTLAGLLTENHYRTIRELANARGLKLYAEATGRFLPAIADNFAVKAHVDVPMGEFWMEDAVSIDALQTAAAAHVHGQKIAAAEAFTSEPENCGWKESPAAFKRLGDRYFAGGINLLFLHTAVHQPWLDRQPGISLGGYGSHFARTNGWLSLAGRPWTDYLSRCQFLLQQGLPVVDFCYFIGEDVPNDLPPRDQLVPPLPGGVVCDACSDAALATMQVRNGRIVLPDGMTYRALVLPSHRKLTLAAVSRIRDLLDAGATICGAGPLESPSLSDETGAFNEIVEDIADRLYDGCLSGIVSTPDFEFSSDQPADILHFHRRDGGVDIYFISNQSDEPAAGRALFRVSGRHPELWHPETGDIHPLQTWVAKGPQTEVPLRLDPQEAVFVVFRRPASDSVLSADQAISTIVKIAGPWTVRFPLKECREIELDTLVSWSDFASEDIKYFSGTAEYRTGFEFSGLEANTRIVLDLGEVGTFASVILNGQPLPLLWHAPYRVDITDEVLAGINHLQVNVTNLLANRIIGDTRRDPSDRTTWLAFNPWSPDAELMPSGLLGPVCLRKRPAGWRQII